MRKFSINGFKVVDDVERNTFRVVTEDLNHVISLVHDLVTVDDLVRIQIWDVTDDNYADDTDANFIGEWSRNRNYMGVPRNPITAIGGRALPHNN